MNRFITETEFVYCAVRTESLNINLVNFRLRRFKDETFFESKASATYFVASAALNISGTGQIFVLYITSHLDVFDVYTSTARAVRIFHTHKQKKTLQHSFHSFRRV